MTDADQLVLTDDGVDTPDRLVGRTGTITVEKPGLAMDMTFTAGGVRETEPELLTFPPTGEQYRGYDLPEGHVRIDGRLYEVVDERDLSECPHCGSDRVAAHDLPPRCYACERDIEPDAEAERGEA